MRIVNAATLAGLGAAMVLLSACSVSTKAAAPTTAAVAPKEVDVSIVTAIDGDGTVECSRVDYLRMAANSHYAPRISLDERGGIAQIADRYHP